VKKNNILITGGSGFIGTNLVNYLLAKNYNIINLDKNSYASTPENFKIIKNKKKYKYFKVNLLDKQKIFFIVKKFKPHTIIHLAAESHVDRSINEYEIFIKNNILGTFNLLNIAQKVCDYKKKNIKLIHISTDEVYGSNTGQPSKETSPYKPRSPYAASKASSDHIAMSFWHTYNFPIIILNLCNNYGPYQFTEKFIPTIVFNFINKKKIPVYGNGKNIREWIYVEDCCRAIEKIIRNGKPGSHYNIGSGVRYNNLYLIKKIYKILKKLNLVKSTYKKSIKFVKDRPGHDFRYALNASLFKNKTKWNCQINLTEGLKKTIQWYLNNKKWYKHTKKIYKGERLGLK